MDTNNPKLFASEARNILIASDFCKHYTRHKIVVHYGLTIYI